MTPSLPAVCGLKHGVSGGSLYPSTSGSFLVSAEVGFLQASVTGSHSCQAPRNQGEETKDLVNFQLVGHPEVVPKHTLVEVAPAMSPRPYRRPASEFGCTRGRETDFPSIGPKDTRQNGIGRRRGGYCNQGVRGLGTDARNQYPANRNRAIGAKRIRQSPHWHVRYIPKCNRTRPQGHVAHRRARRPGPVLSRFVRSSPPGRGGSCQTSRLRFSMRMVAQCFRAPCTRFCTVKLANLRNPRTVRIMVSITYAFSSAGLVPIPTRASKFPI